MRVGLHLYLVLDDEDRHTHIEQREPHRRCKPDRYPLEMVDPKIIERAMAEIPDSLKP